VFFEDECHLLWGDLCRYVWGKTNERIEVPIVNERRKQTYYGAVNLLTQQCLVQAYESGNSESTIAFLKYLLSQCPNRRIAVLWDGASYHRSIEVRAYLASVNQSLEESEWKLTCIRCDLFESATICVNLLLLLSIYLSLLLIAKSLTFQSCLPMGISHN
jgi:hypothetical protein